MRGGSTEPAAARLNPLWSSTLIRTCLLRGVGTFFVAPGSRSTPLTMAIAHAPDATIHTHFDERGLAFACLGYVKGSGNPAAFVCTSGTAVANAFPAVIEAAQLGLPLLLLTADRPPELRDTGANQTIDQSHLFGRYAHWFVDLPPASDSIPLQYVQSTMHQAIDRLRTGPVHINCMFREPFGGKDSHYHELAIKSERNRGTAVESSSSGIPPHVATAANRIDESPLRAGRTLVMVGEASREDTLAARAWADRQGVAFASDVASGLHEASLDYALAHGEFRAGATLPPETIIHVGGRIVAPRWLRFLTAHPPRHFLRIQRDQFRIDPLRIATQTIVAEPAKGLDSVRLTDVDTSFTARWRQLLEDTQRRCNEFLAEVPDSEPGAVRAAIAATAEGEAIFLGNSMPVRDAESFAWWPAQKDLRVGTNRGASGIDGNIASAVGFALGSRRPTTTILGDLAFLHDLNSLALVRSAGIPIRLVVIQNDGGGIFHFLPIAAETVHFERLFAMPHGLASFQRAAELFGLDYAQPATSAELHDQLVDWRDRQASGILEMRTDRRENHDLHRRIEQAISEARL